MIVGSFIEVNDKIKWKGDLNENQTIQGKRLCLNNREGNLNFYCDEGHL